MNQRALNLLPEEAVRAYRKSRRLDVVARLLAGLGALLVINVVYAGAAWQYLSIIHEAEKGRQTVTEKSAELALATEFEGKLQELTSGLKVLRTLSEPQYDPSMLLRDVVNVLPAQARVQKATVNLQGASERTRIQKSGSTAKPSSDKQDGKQIVFISGTAATRADVLAFQHALEALPYVQYVDAPVANILKPVDTSFSFALTLKPPVAAPVDSEKKPDQESKENGS